MKDATIITLFSLLCLLIFTCIAVMQGHDDYLVYTTIFIFATAAGVMLPQPKFVRE
ncbi:MAG: hypothetical protein JRE40_12675 [Deltaproteobacteria bacterium]|nr:hypothetical protein [Deltaproteobacteria bacterium]